MFSLNTVRILIKVLVACIKLVVWVQVGKTGLSVGIDVRKAAVKLSTSNIKRLRSTSQDFASQASSCKIELHNVFMPSNKHKVSQPLSRYCSSPWPQFDLALLVKTGLP